MSNQIARRRTSAASQRTTSLSIRARVSRPSALRAERCMVSIRMTTALGPQAFREQKSLTAGITAAAAGAPDRDHDHDQKIGFRHGCRDGNRRGTCRVMCPGLYGVGLLDSGSSAAAAVTVTKLWVKEVLLGPMTRVSRMAVWACSEKMTRN